jgi:mannose-6-phosphate isomerase
MRLATIYVEKTWGRYNLPDIFVHAKNRQIGEIWFEEEVGERLPLLVKYIFTSERLSIQVHPNDEQAKALDFPHGKDECWYVIAATPDSEVGIGLTSHLPHEDLRLAAMNGSIEHLLNWRQVQAGDFFYIPAGTIHAIGAGVTLIEVQQNIDLTFRLYDYGRPRELHLDAAIAASTSLPIPTHFACNWSTQGTHQLVNNSLFSLLATDDVVGNISQLVGHHFWLIPLSGKVSSGNDSAVAGECLYLDSIANLEVDANTTALIAVSTSE